MPVVFFVLFVDCRLDIRGFSVARELERMPAPSSTTDIMARFVTLSVSS
jgi:hypothetical protein